MKLLANEEKVKWLGSIASSLKKNKETFDLLTDINMLLVAGKGIREEVCHEIH